MGTDNTLPLRPVLSRGNSAIQAYRRKRAFAGVQVLVSICRQTKAEEILLYSGPVWFIGRTPRAISVRVIVMGPGTMTATGIVRAGGTVTATGYCADH